mmetsp:Transcript_1416/g.3632  ORF Transcript_1416/g.3632 Transcript_1416/m.3632 type:complete len:428 (-) Transcript_1416:671-1954(-)
MVALVGGGFPLLPAGVGAPSRRQVGFPLRGDGEVLPGLVDRSVHAVVLLVDAAGVAHDLPALLVLAPERGRRRLAVGAALALPVGVQRRGPSAAAAGGSTRLALLLLEAGLGFGPVVRVDGHQVLRRERDRLVLDLLQLPLLLRNALHPPLRRPHRRRRNGLRVRVRGRGHADSAHDDTWGARPPVRAPRATRLPRGHGGEGAGGRVDLRLGEVRRIRVVVVLVVRVVGAIFAPAGLLLPPPRDRLDLVRHLLLLHLLDVALALAFALLRAAGRSRRRHGRRRGRPLLEHFLLHPLSGLPLVELLELLGFLEGRLGHLARLAVVLEVDAARVAEQGVVVGAVLAPQRGRRRRAVGAELAVLVGVRPRASRPWVARAARPRSSAVGPRPRAPRGPTLQLEVHLEVPGDRQRGQVGRRARLGQRPWLLL